MTRNIIVEQIELALLSGILNDVDIAIMLNVSINQIEEVKNKMKGIA